MTGTQVTYLVAGGAGLLGIVAYAGLILVPAWTSYSRLWERFAAFFLSLYVLVALVGLGVGGGLALVYFWDQL